MPSTLKAFTKLADKLAAPPKPACQSTLVEYEDDPKMPGRTAIRISGPSREHVQHHIDLATNWVERIGGYARFIGPARIPGGFAAMGEALTHRMEAAE